jgi:hypothetical protein
MGDFPVSSIVPQRPVMTSMQKPQGIYIEISM